MYNRSAINYNYSPSLEFLQTIHRDAIIEQFSAQWVDLKPPLEPNQTQVGNVYGTIKLLFTRFGSDKDAVVPYPTLAAHPYGLVPHSYAPIYELILKNRRDARAVFECGIGSDKELVDGSLIRGSSIRVWHEYFQKAEIFAGDINEEVLFQEGRIHSFKLDQTDPNSIAAFFRQSCALIENGMFDVMIDDGKHSYDAALCLFEHASPFLAKLGIYVIEDMRMSDLYKIYDFFKNKSAYCVSYAVMATPNQMDNNMVIIQKKA